MTTRFKASDLVEGVSGAIHETGHALYEQGRPAAYDNLPVSRGAPLPVMMGGGGGGGAFFCRRLRLLRGIARVGPRGR